jgi:phosphatidylinositol alpha-1,6-mannosyltransferase
MARKLSERGHPVMYAAPAEAVGPSGPRDEAYGVGRIEGDDWRHHKDRYLLGALLRLWRTHRPSVVICLTWKVARVPLLLRSLTGWRVVVVAHGMEVTKKGRRLRRRIGLRWIFGSADLAVAVSRYTRDRVAEFGVRPERVMVLPCGVDPERFRPRDGALTRRRLGLEGRPVLLTLARVVRRKGHDLVIRALPEVHRRFPEAVYVVAGGGKEGHLASLRELAHACGVDGSVRILGHAPDDDLPGLYSASDVYVMVSRANPRSGNYEGFGITYLEANACGVPAIGAESGGVPDAVVDGETGFLIPPEDVHSLADRIVWLLGDPALARTLGENGRARVLRAFTWDRVAERLLAALAERRIVPAGNGAPAA